MVRRILFTFAAALALTACGGKAKDLKDEGVIASTDTFLRHFGIESLDQLPEVDLNPPEGEVGA